jgi:hypothetical protein
MSQTRPEACGAQDHDQQNFIFGVDFYYGLAVLAVGKFRHGADTRSN